MLVVRENDLDIVELSVGWWLQGSCLLFGLLADDSVLFTEDFLIAERVKNEGE